VTDPRARLFGVVLAAAGAVLPAGGAMALEPWVAPDIARPCPRFGPGWIEVSGSRTCVRIGGRVVAEYGTSVKSARPAFGREGERPNGFSSRAKVRAEARTETDLGDLTLVYQADVPGRRTLGR
jgi:hypothetical protein